MDIYLGNELIALGALYSGAACCYAYPGTPSSEILTSFQKFAPNRYSSWSINEKVAFELGAAAAISGSYAFCAMKQVGLNVAADPLFSVSYTGITGALVIVAADEPGSYSSQTEQDSRMYAYSAKIPVLDPSSPEDAFYMTIKAFNISKKYGIPVILRPVMRVAHSKINFEPPKMNIKEAIKGTFLKEPSRWAATPKFRGELHAKLIEKLSQIADNEKENIKIKKQNPTAIVASGYVYSIAKDYIKQFNIKTDIIKIDMPYPISPNLLSEIENSYKKILILEETTPLIERSFVNRAHIYGKTNGTVTEKGEFTADRCIETFEKFFEKPLSHANMNISHEEEPTVKPRLCPGCGHRSAFFAIKKAFPMAIFPGDIGCYTLGINLKAVDTCICMGASITFAESLKRENPDKTVIASIGDSTFFHSGIPAIINAKINNSPITVVIMDNSTTAMTGFQPVAHKDNKVSIEKILKGMEIDFIKTCDPYDINKSVKLIKDAAIYAETNKIPSIVIFKRECVTERKQIFNQAPIINDKCTDCGICYEVFECPAITSIGEKANIDPSSCNGCLCCLEICPHGAIEKGQK